MYAPSNPDRLFQSLRNATLGLVTVASVALVPLNDAIAKLPFEYAAKVVCGTQADKADKGSYVTRGIYATTINIRNPNANRTMIIKYFVATLPPGNQRQTQPAKMSGESIQPNAALASDCRDIAERVKVARPFWEGFLVIESEQSLDVVGVYTSSTIENVQSGIEVVHIPERNLRDQ